ncbi:hypothetical protein [Pseudobutyrivibrio xylanivorans]|uniref:RloB domain-containing protein n=1 Tax=Pseudobutyrivibrio xylanivorans TaxID=185007 RepID=A0A5P6VR88_PSEXY|nr:hypothetical protein [Pseudobutyrivibrio xylanivorans]QFJ55010.1 hypothetical protein FXF36_09110 [Pseudobutyrivibrio xylanivorans]
MEKRLPIISNKHKICIICEGNEEYKYLERLNELEVWNPIYDVSLVNAAGNGNIPARYQDRYQNGSYEVVLVFCDTEKKPYEQFEDIKRKINEFHGVDNASDEVVFFANPCTMQIVSKHWTDEIIKSPAKPVNAPMIERYTGVKNYKGKASQIDEVMKFVTSENYDVMREHLDEMTSDEREVGSTNFDKLLVNLHDDNTKWMEKLNQLLEI